MPITTVLYEVISLVTIVCFLVTGVLNTGSAIIRKKQPITWHLSIGLTAFYLAVIYAINMYGAGSEWYGPTSWYGRTFIRPGVAVLSGLLAAASINEFRKARWKSKTGPL